MASSAVARSRDDLKRLDEAEATPCLWKVMFISGMGFFTDAYDLFIIGVAVSILKIQWHLSSFDTALLNSTTLIASALGAIVFGRVADMLGRKKIYVFEVLILAAGAIASAISPSLAWLVIFRFILGLGIGGDYPVSATIMSEYAGKKIRGKMVALVFGMQGAGLVVGPLLASALLATGMDHNLVWRLLLGFGAIPGLSVFYMRRRLRETPRWAALHGDKGEASKAAGDVTGGKAGTGTAPEGTGANTSDAASQGRQGDAAPEETVLSGYGDLFGDRRLLKWLIGACGAWFLLDFAYYGNTISSPILIKIINPKNTLLENTLISLAIFAVFALPGYLVAALTIDRVGRKAIQCMGFAAMAILFGALGLILGATKEALPFVLLFGLSYFFTEFGPNTTTFVYPSEIFPVQIRTTAHGIAAAVGKIGAFAGAFAFPFMLDNIKLTGTMVVVAITSIGGLLVTLALLPEPKGRSLEEIAGEADPAQPGQGAASARMRAS